MYEMGNTQTLTSSEGRAEVRDQGQQKGCAPNGLNHSTVNSSPSPPSNLSNQNLNLSLFASTINSMSANKLLTQLAHQNQLKSSAHHQQLAANSAKRKLAEKMLLNERLSPSSGDSSKPASCDFVSSIDICAEYAQNFRDQSIDGMGLPMLTEEHLRNLLSMKLGPALKLKAILATKMGTTCASCEKYRNSLSPAPSIKAIAEATPATISNASSRTPTPSSGIVESGGFNIPTPTLSRPQSNSTTEIAQT